jgi:tripartite-type tricarboxylate transporter receptor subunit TctC
VTTPSLLMTHPSVRVNGVGELIDLGKRNPGTLNYASPGRGSGPHLAMEVFKIRTGAHFVHVPYKGLAPATTDLLANHVQLMFSSPVGFEEMISAGRLLALAVTGKARFKALPGIRTLSEVGNDIPELDSGAAFGILAPGGTPHDIITELGQTFQTAIRDDAFAAAIERMGFQPVGSTPDEFRSLLAAEIERWGDVIKRTGIGLE